MTEIVERFTIDQPPDAVWAFFQDVPAVVTCIPGLALTGEEPPDKYRGKVRMRLGPVSAAFEGEATIIERDAAGRRARIEGQGLDRQGGSRASARVDYAIVPSGAGSEVTVTAEIKLTGALAQIGRTGIVQDVARELTSVFATTLRDRLAASAPALPASQAAPTASATTAPTSPPATSAPPPDTPTLGIGFLLRVIWRRLLSLVTGR